MKNPFKLLLRRIALGRRRSDVPHGITPLSHLRCATVLIDAEQQDAEATAGAARQFFGYHNIGVKILCPSKDDCNIIGGLKKSRRGEPLAAGDAEIFISLLDREDNFLSDNEAVHSRAVFKVGRREIPGKVYDMIILPPDGEKASQSAVFSAFKEYIIKIR